MKFKALPTAVPICLLILVTMQSPADDFPLPKGEPEKGFDILINKHLSSTAFTVEELNNLWKVWEPELKVKAETASPEERRKMTFERYGLTHREFDKTGLPLGYTDDGKGNLAANCFSCHGGKVAGRSIPGVGNSHQDLTGLILDITRLRTLISGGDPSTVKRLPSPIPFNFAKGVSNATQFSIFLGAMRDENLDSKPLQLTQKFVNNDVDAPPWWNYKYKEKIYCDAFAPPTPRTLMQFTMSPAVTGEQIRSWEPEFQHIEAFIRNLEPPKYPFEINRELAAKGERVFNQTCAKCHGTYGAKPEYPNEVVPIKEIGTDPVRFGAIAPESKEDYNRTWFSDYGKHPVDIETKGYIAQPLHGIWASAPYLHNGSVPTVYQLFNSDKRPKVWKRSEDGYDQKRIGLEVEELDAVPEGLSEREQRMYYDTTTVSHGNTGHLFPEQELNEQEKVWVMEYLKTL